MSKSIYVVGDDDFESAVLKSEKPVMVDFWAPWCGPCKAITPIIEELAEAFGDKIRFVKFNVDESPITPGTYSIRAIPTLIFFKNGEILKEITGITTKSKLEEALNEML